MLIGITVVRYRAHFHDGGQVPAMQKWGESRAVRSHASGGMLLACCGVFRVPHAHGKRGWHGTQGRRAVGR